MLFVISPAKSLDYQTPLPIKKHTKAAFLEDSSQLIAGLKTLSPPQVGSLMGISETLAQLNFQRYQEWKQPFSPRNARQAILAFKGDVYLGLDAYHFTDENFAYAQEHLRILSGLYGLLRPLDLMQPYRLEMGTKYANDRGNDLYAFWGQKITTAINTQLRRLKSKTLINLASNEYFKSVDKKHLDAAIVTPVFKDWKNGKYKIISFFAKKARGRMSAYAIEKGLTSPEQLLEFDWDGYGYDESLSTESDWVFTRRQ